MKKILTILFILILNNIYSQETFAYQSKRHLFNKYLIDKNITNKIKKKQFEKGFQYEVTYLGSFKTTKGLKFYIINSSYVNLKSLHNDNEIFIYNNKKEFVGYYNLATNYQLPILLKNNKLFFKLEDCGNKILKINFNSGIQNIIELKCDNDNVDVIEFITKS